jgi:hypothetical protein
VSEITEQELEDIEALFVQSAAGFSSDEGAVTLHGVSPSTLYFADRPQREVGHLTSRRFVDLWDEGENSFAIDPPNAVLSFLEHDDARPEDAVVMLLDPRLEGEELTYRVDVLEGELPAKAGPCSLFIDPFGRPLSPVSAAGIHRRERRRTRRRI